MSVNKKDKKSVSTQALESITDGKEETKANKLLSLIPEGHSPKVYIDLVKTQVLGHSKTGEERPDEDLMFFLYTAKRTGLDPLVNQIYAVYRWDSRIGREKMTIQTGIDGMRLVAQRTGEYAGQDDATFTPEDESTQYPIKATVTVYKLLNGTRVPFTATARWSEYVQLDKQGKPSGLWGKMPYLMLSKCAEALALRKAFPNELSGIYSDVEMQQSSNILADLPAPERAGKPNNETGGRITVEHGAPADIKPTTDPARKVPEDKDGEGAKKAAENASEGDIGTAETKEITNQERENEPQGIEAAADIAAMRNKLKDNGTSN